MLRRAEVEGASGFAVTWFVEGCGSTAQRAGQRWAEALDLVVPFKRDTYRRIIDAFGPLIRAAATSAE